MCIYFFLELCVTLITTGLAVKLFMDYSLVERGRGALALCDTRPLTSLFAALMFCLFLFTRRNGTKFRVPKLEGS